MSLWNAKRFMNHIPTAFVYLKDDEEHISCPLVWWREHHPIFPSLFKLMRRVLYIPATSAPAEHVFSSAGLTITNNRARLTGEHAAAQIFLHDYYSAVQLHQERSESAVHCFDHCGAVCIYFE